MAAFWSEHGDWNVFDAVVFESNVIDDVTVTLFGNVAIVRGRTGRECKAECASVSARIRFTDVFIKRNGQWQAVASHASTLVQASGDA